jgi:predicted acetyltransferase
VNTGLVVLKKIGETEQSVLEHLFQFYVYEFSTMIPSIVAEPDGRFSIPNLKPYLTDNRYHSFLMSTGQELCGFVIVDTNSDALDTRSIKEFFVMRKYAGRGIGKQAAIQVFERFPGKWRIDQIANNYPAQAFWRKTLDEYTKGAFTEWYENRKAFQAFETSLIPELRPDQPRVF